MAKRRDKIRMTDEEIWKFVEERKSLQVATLNRDGKSQKIVNLKRDPRIAVLLEAGTDYSELRGVSINGTALLHSDPEVVHRYALEVMSRNQPGLPRETLDSVAKDMATKRTAVVVKPEKIVTWDHRKLGGSY
jgi:hypothetical protein